MKDRSKFLDKIIAELRKRERRIVLLEMELSHTRAELQRLEARIAALTAPKQPSPAAIEWGKKEIKARSLKPTTKRAPKPYDEEPLLDIPTRTTT